MGLVVDGFAYAPNFITKIIQDQTGIEPKGLLTIDEGKGGASSSDETATAVTSKPVNGDATGHEATRVVKTRFPPEPNGYLHLGHAKAVSFNFAVSRMFGGVCHMRLDDTNPTKEDEEYVQSILEDVKWIQNDFLEEGQEVPWDGPVRKTSGYFDKIYDSAIELIKSGDAYVDSLSAEEMREYRGSLTEPGKDSPYRTRSIEENLELFEGMKDGKFKEGEHVLRAKIDMASPNINMRDPTLYRIKHESHQETGDKWCIYPMYDFSHPISDALEGITHSLCTLEFEDHRPFYDWTIEKLLPTKIIDAQPQQIEFSRLNVQSTVLSKRKLIQLVTDKIVSGWDDPRMPTLSGMRRRGIPASALRLFCERVGISKADSNIDYTNLEDCIRETMDDTVPRAFSVLKPLKVTITNYGEDMEEFEVDRHPKIPEMGQRSIPFGQQVFIERDDFFDLEGPEGKSAGGRPPKGFKRLVGTEGGMVRLRYAYVIELSKIVRDPKTQDPIELKCTYVPETRAGVTPEGMQRVKGIIHWVEASSAVKCTINQYDRLFSTEEPGKESGDYLKDINPESLQVLDSVVEPSVAQDAARKLDEISKSSDNNPIYPSSLAYQFERSGYFAMDKDATSDKLVFNRVATLRDTWGIAKQDKEKQQQQRSRGGGRGGRQQAAKEEPVEDLRRVAMTAATILSVNPHPEADALLVCEVDCGDKSEDGAVAPRTVVAGLAGKIAPEDLVGRKVVTVTNLKPAKMRGIESTAMLLAASDGQEGDDEKVELLQVPGSVPNGELMAFEGKEPSQPDAMMKSKGALKAWERVKACLKSSKEGEAMYVADDGSSFKMVSSAGAIMTETLREAVIQ